MPDSYRYLNPIHSYFPDHGALILDCGGPRVAISLLTERIARVRLAPGGSFAPRRSWAVAPPDDAFPGTATTLTETETALTLRTSALAVQIDRASGRIAFQDPAGLPFCADACGLSWSIESGAVRCAKRIESGEHFYGFGERTGRLEQTGNRLVNWTTDQYRYMPGTDPLYIAIPAFVSARPAPAGSLAYGVFFNNTWRSAFDMGASRNGSWSMEAEGGELDYYVVYGPTPAAVLAGFGQILGTTPLPPRWALGYHQSRWGYASDEELHDLATEFRRRDIPIDAIHFDIDYMDGYRDFTWHPERFPEPKRLIADLRAQDIRVVTIVDPGVKIDPDYRVYQQGMELDMFIRRADGEVFHGYVWPDDAVFPDFTRPEVRRWWGEMQDGLIAAGASGIWNDMNEPTVFSRPFSEGGGDPHTIDSDALQGPVDERTTHAEVHNLYGSAMAQASFEGLRSALGVRPFVLTRSGFAGIQRWSACWMGDNTSRWEFLEMAITQVLSMGLSGAPFVGTDIGGFFDNASGELFARWMQFGALMPFCRGHSHAETERHEPWAFDEHVEAICREYIGLRYRLLPYIYTLFWQAAQSGAPVVRPLFYEFPDDPATYQIGDQVLLGPSLLAAPIYQPGKRHRHVYLPAGVWYDWWTGEEISGPAHLLADAPLERMPLYVRAGAIIPGAPVAANTAAQAGAPLTLDVYPGSGDLTFYEDDGESFDYEQGAWSTTAYRVVEDGAALRIEIGERSGRYSPPPRRFLLRIHGLDAGADGQIAGATYDPASRVLALELNDGEPASLELRLG